MPNNAAIAALEGQPDAPDLTDPAVATELLLAHANNAQVLTEAEVLALPFVEVAGGQQQPVGTDPTTVGGAPVIQADVAADNGVIHVLSAVMST